MYTYPIDKEVKKGVKFWTLPKRPPKPITFDPKNKLHAYFIAATSCLWAKIFGITIPKDPRSDKTKFELSEKAMSFK
jgi:hypothetical protein